MRHGRIKTLLKHAGNASLSIFVGILISLAILAPIYWVYVTLTDKPTHWESYYTGVDVGTVSLRAGEWQMHALDNVCAPYTCFFMRTSDYMHPEYNFSRRSYAYFEPDNETGLVTVYQKFSVSEDTTATIVDRCADIRPTPIIQGARRIEEGEDGYDVWYTTYKPEWRM